MSPRAVLEKLAAIQTLDMWPPTTDGRYLVMPRYTEPEADLALLLHQLKLILPRQPLPRLVGAPVAVMPQLKMLVQTLAEPPWKQMDSAPHMHPSAKVRPSVPTAELGYGWTRASNTRL